MTRLASRRRSSTLQKRRRGLERPLLYASESDSTFYRTVDEEKVKRVVGLRPNVPVADLLRLFCAAKGEVVNRK
jgi:hypothetical protein